MGSCWPYHSSYLPGWKVYHDQQGGTFRLSPFHCTSVRMAPTIISNADNLTAQFLIVGLAFALAPFVIVKMCSRSFVMCHGMELCANEVLQMCTRSPFATPGAAAVREAHFPSSQHWGSLSKLTKLISLDSLQKEVCVKSTALRVARPLLGLSVCLSQSQTLIFTGLKESLLTRPHSPRLKMNVRSVWI